jgi:hypothetical protein
LVHNKVIPIHPHIFHPLSIFTSIVFRYLSYLPQKNQPFGWSTAGLWDYFFYLVLQNTPYKPAEHIPGSTRNIREVGLYVMDVIVLNYIMKDIF